MIRLLTPGRGDRPGRAVDVEVTDDRVRERVIIVLHREHGPRRHMIATTEQALDLALALTGAAMRLRGGIEP